MKRDECDECLRAYEDGLKKEIDCESCKTVVLAPENERAWEIIADVSGMLFTGGSVNASAIELIFELHGVEDYEAMDIYQKIMAYAHEAIDAAGDKQ